MSLFEKIIPNIIAGIVDILFFTVVGLLGYNGKLGEPTLAALLAAYASARFKTIRDTGSTGGNNASASRSNSDRPEASKPSPGRYTGRDLRLALVLAPLSFALLVLAACSAISSGAAQKDGGRLFPERPPSACKVRQ